MIARLLIRTPFTVTVPEGAIFKVPVYEMEGYKIVFYPPKRSTEQEAKNKNRQVKIGGTLTFEADLIHIDFIKADFNRSQDILAHNPAVCDPPIDLIQNTVTSFLLRLRHVTKSSVIRPIDIKQSSWRLNYLNDDGSELLLKEGFYRTRVSKTVSMSWTSVTDKIWDDIHALPPNYEPQPWESLLLDAVYPGVSDGNAIVLAATALEVFIARILDLLASDSTAPVELWNWINNRGDHTREPSVEEQFDVLLKIMSGHSLKDEKELWPTFKNLRSARNSFVHTGVVKVGKKIESLSKDEVSILVSSASKIIEKVRSWLPEKYQWKQFNYDINVEAAFPLFEIKPKEISQTGVNESSG